MLVVVLCSPWRRTKSISCSIDAHDLSRTHDIFPVHCGEAILAISVWPVTTERQLTAVKVAYLEQTMCEPMQIENDSCLLDSVVIG